MTQNADLGRVTRIDAFKAECRCGWWDRMVSTRENADKMLATHLREKHGTSGSLDHAADLGRRVIPDPPEEPIKQMLPEYKVAWRQGWVAGYEAALAHNSSYGSVSDG